LRVIFRAYRDVWAIHNIRVMVFVQFLSQLIFYSTVIVAFQTGRGISYAGMFWLESIVSAAVFICEMPTGVLADRLRFRRMIVLGEGLMFAGYVVFAVARGFWPFALSAALYGAGLACLSGCDSALIYESLPAEGREELSARAYSLVRAAGSAGFFCGLASGSFLGAWSPDLAVYTSLMPVGLAWVASFRLRGAAVPGAPLAGAGPAPVTAGAEPGALSVGTLLRSALRLVRQDPFAVGLSLFGSAGFALASAVLWYNQLLFALAGIPVAWFGPLTAAATGLQVLVALTAPAAGRRLGTGGALALACLVPGAAYLGLARFTWPAGTVLLVAGVLAGSAWRAPLLDAALNERIPAGARATTLSALSFVGRLAAIGLNPMIGMAGDLGPSFAAGALGLGLLGLGALVLPLARMGRK
jgi:MFS family permease